MSRWSKQFRFDPVPPLLASGNEALLYFTRRDLLREPVGPLSRVWELPGAQKIVRKQLADGSWPRPGPKKHAATNYGLIETWRQLRFLVEMYGFTREEPHVKRAAEFIFSCQMPEGDLRGMLANQYITYYTGAIMSLVIQAGYGDDPRVEKSLQWLLAMRQDDGAWSVAIMTHKLDRATQYRLVTQIVPPLEPDRSKPFSHNATGMILRAFAVHERYRHAPEAQVAAALLKSRFFQPDAYTSYHAASYWLRFEYPFWWSNLVTALDSLSRMGFSRDDPQIRQALSWLVDHQQPDGLWRTSYVQATEEDTAKVREVRPWITLSICRIFRRLYEKE